jgi:hypothetical protein
VSNFSFTPASLTIKIGDTVRWTNAGGNHNVVADDNSFTSGTVSSSSWVYEFTFNVLGSFGYYCALHGGPGGSGMSGIIIVEALTDVTKEENSPSEFSLKQNYPNPFNPTTKIRYSIPSVTLSGVEGSRVQLKIYDVLGNEVATLVNEEKPAGSYEVNFNAARLSSGIYFYTLQTENFVETKKMILMK